MNEQDFFLWDRRWACFRMNTINGWWNGVAASLRTDFRDEAVFQFDDGMVAEGNNMMTSAIMIEVLQWKTRKRVPSLINIPEWEIVWAIDSRCSYPGPARGFLAFQKRVSGEAMNIVCMGMKKDYRDSPDENNLSTPTVNFVPYGQEVINEDYPTIHVPADKQHAFSYFVGRLYQAHKKGMLPSLGQALDRAKDIFLDPFEPESIAHIKAVFGIK